MRSKLKSAVGGELGLGEEQLAEKFQTECIGFN